MYYIDSMNALVETGSMATMIIREIPDELKKEFKKACIDEDVSMNGKVIELIKDYVETVKVRR